MEQYFSADELRNIIHNAHKIKEFNKCHQCNGTGWENWNSETGDDVKPGGLGDYHEDRDDGECEKCDGVGYVDLTMYGD
jgi:hypothetical protein